MARPVVRIAPAPALAAAAGCAFARLRVVDGQPTVRDRMLLPGRS